LRRGVVAGAVVALVIVGAIVAALARHDDETSQFENSCAASELPGCSTAVVLTLRFRP
jgi:hypothetical protein